MHASPNRRRPIRLALLACLAIVMAFTVACGSDSDEGAGAVAPGSDEWQAGGGSEWKKVLAAAKEEGEVVLDASPELTASDFASEFERDTGIKLTYAAGESSARYISMDQEAKTNKLSVDVSLGGGAELATMLPGDLLKPIEPQLLLPGVSDPTNWADGEIKWMDPKGQYLLQPSEYVFGWVVANTDEVGELDSWDDLLDPSMRGKIASYDVTSGPGQAAAAFYMDALGPEFVEKLYGEQDVKFTRNRRQLVEWIARGSYAIGLGATQADVESFREQGLPVNGVLPAEGPGALLGGSSVLKQPQNADGSPGPHPNAATVFINWYLSKPGQEAYNRTMREISRRKDVGAGDTVPEYVRPDEGREYIDTYTYDWYVEKRPELVEELADVLG